jgi:hypothetical protein
MAELEINLSKQIQAVISGGDRVAYANVPVILDPITKSYSDYAPLTYYNLTIRNIYGLENPVILNNGKHSRFTAGGKGECEVELRIEDALGNYAVDTVIIEIR